MERSFMLRVTNLQPKRLAVMGPPAPGHSVGPGKERSACEIGCVCRFWIGLDQGVASKSEVSNPRRDRVKRCNKEALGGLLLEGDAGPGINIIEHALRLVIGNNERRADSNPLHPTL